MENSIPYGKQLIDKDDINSVIEVLKSDWITQGPKVEEFENSISRYCNSKYAVAVNSATSALHIACRALELKSGDILWTSPNSFVASANCGLYCDSIIDFVDIDPLTYNMSIDKLEKKLINAESSNSLPKVIIPVHFAGQSCDMQRLHSLSKKYNFKILEDASHALGASYKDYKVGSCKYSDITVFSFHPVKIITTGEGGVATTNSSILQKRMTLFRSHGITKENIRSSSDVGAWSYEQIDLGYNYRLSDINAALGCSQIKKIDEFVKKRNSIAQKYNIEFNKLSIGLPTIESFNYSSWHLYPITLESSHIRKYIYEELRKRNINTNIHYIPIHTQPYFRKLGFKVGDFPESEKYYSKTLSLPIFPALPNSHQSYVIDTIKDLLS